MYLRGEKGRRGGGVVGLYTTRVVEVHGLVVGAYGWLWM